MSLPHRSRPPQGLHALPLATREQLNKWLDDSALRLRDIAAKMLDTFGVKCAESSLSEYNAKRRAAAMQAAEISAGTQTARVVVPTSGAVEITIHIDSATQFRVQVRPIASVEA